MKPIAIEQVLSNKYSHLLAMLIVFVITAPLVEHGERAWGFRVLTLLLLATIIICLRAVIVRRRVYWLCVLAAGAAFALDVLSTRAGAWHVRQTLHVFSIGVDSIFALATIVILMRHMFQMREVTLDTIIGGICVYLLIGIQWGLMYSIISTVNRGAIASETAVSIFYFSFSTLTTLGYGDIVPLSKLSQVLANLEAITGQIYLAVFVARLVGLHTARSVSIRSDVRHK